jgi:hypothetical protein
MGDSSADGRPAAENRRSSRIVQSVPLSVTGADALGHPFVERTSTVIVNCHGCRYQSKHYVVKDMWLTLEVPRTDAARAPRHVRARVMWIQRPQNARDLFQVGVELETPGNLWGIAFAPSDWVPFPDTGFEDREIYASEDVNSSVIEQPPNRWSASEPLVAEDSVRMMRVASQNDVPAALARQMERLVNEAKQELHEAIWDRATEPLPAEGRPLIAALHAQFQEGHWLMQDRGQAVDPRTNTEVVHTREKIAERMREAGEAALCSLREQWNRELHASVREAHKRMATEFGRLEQERRAAFEQQIASNLSQASEALQRVANDVRPSLRGAPENLDEFRNHGEQAAAPSREIEDRPRALSDDAHAEVERLKDAARQFQQTTAALLAGAESTLQSRLDAGATNAAMIWNERIEELIEKAAKRAGDEITRSAQKVVSQIENDAGLRIVAIAEQTVSERARVIGEECATAISQREARFVELQASLREEDQHVRQTLAEASSLAASLEQQAAGVGARAERTKAEFEKHISSLAEANGQNLERLVGDSVTTCVARLDSALEQAGRQIMARLGADFEAELSARLHLADEAFARLQRETDKAEEMLREHQDRIANISDHVVEDITRRLDGVASDLHFNFVQAGNVAIAKCLGEIDSKATERTHTAFEALFKTAEWYEKRVQNHMQASVEKGLEQALDILHEKAAEISRLFGSELDRYSRSFVEHTQSQFEEAARETLECVRQQSGEMASAATASVAQNAQNHVEAALTEFCSNARTALAEVAGQMENQSAALRLTVVAETQRFVAECKAKLAEQTADAIAQTQNALASEVEMSKDDLHVQGEMQENQLRQTILSLGNHAVDEYKKRLDDTSNSWLPATINRLHEQSKQDLEALASSAEARLREKCREVFASVGEGLRRRLLELSTLPAEQEIAPGGEQNNNQSAESEPA